MNYKNDPKEMHMYAVEHLLGKPYEVPDERMLVDPIWSTWAQFKTNINQSAVLKVSKSSYLNIIRLLCQKG